MAIKSKMFLGKVKASISCLHITSIPVTGEARAFYKEVSCSVVSDSLKPHRR